MYLDGWSVTAIDLNSANGTLLLRHGAAEWERLSADTRALLQSGDTLRAGDRELRLELHHVQA